jgi:hypothetical protein
MKKRPKSWINTIIGIKITLKTRLLYYKRYLLRFNIGIGKYQQKTYGEKGNRSCQSEKS